MDYFVKQLARFIYFFNQRLFNPNYFYEKMYHAIAVNLSHRHHSFG